MWDIEQSGEDPFVVKSVYEGAQSAAVLLFLKPGQEMPTHPHEHFEVVLTPQKGRGAMTVDNLADVDLVPEKIYFAPAGHMLRIRNTGNIPLQIVITLIRVEPVASPSPPPAPAPAMLEAERRKIEQYRRIIFL